MHSDVTTRRKQSAHLAEPRRRTWWGWMMPALPLGLTLFFVSQLRAVAAGEPLIAHWPWAPSLGVAFSFYMDGLSLLMALLVAGIGTVVMLYAGSYLAEDAQLPRFYAWTTLFMFAMLGVVTAGNLLTLFLFWELTSISSYLLIGYKHKDAKARDAALQALLVTGGGGLALLAGFLLLGSAAGSYELADLLADAGSLQEHPYYVPMLLLILAGAFTKSAQFPFHFWLPGAMSAPTPVSAYLHSATMVKAGVFLLARLAPVLGGSGLWSASLTAVGAITLLVGAWLAWQQSDLKRILAYTTIGALGTLVMLLGIGTEIAFKAAMVFLLAHSLYKASLFLVAGSIDHATHSRDVWRLGGLTRKMPWSAATAGLAALSLAGMAPFLGFVGKELTYEATLFAPGWPWALTAIAVAANGLLIVAAGLAAYQPFAGAPTAPAAHAHEGDWRMVAGPLLLAVLGLVAAFVLTPLANGLVTPAVAAVAGRPVSVKLALWHGINPMLILSVVTLTAGIAAFALRRPLLAAVSGWPQGERWGPARGYQAALNGLKAGAPALTRRVQAGRLRSYVQTVLGTAVVLLGWALWRGLAWQEQWLALESWASSLQPYEVGLAGMILFAAVMAARARSRLAAIVALGVAGLGMTLIFALYSAPDLAMTQFAVETLTVLLFVLVLYRLPRFVAFTRPRQRLADALVAGGLGLVMTLLVLTAVVLPHPGALAGFFAENSLSLANGRNVVNVILVDFRSLDTLGEIVVLASAAIGVFTLMNLRLEKRGAAPPAEEQPAGGRVLVTQEAGRPEAVGEARRRAPAALAQGQEE